MTKKRKQLYAERVRRKKAKRSRAPASQPAASSSKRETADSTPVTALHHSLSNQTAQRLLAQRDGSGTVEAHAGTLQGERGRALSAQVGRARGNRHVQRLVDALQVSRKGKEHFRKRDVRDVLNTILGLVWNSQSGCKQPIRLTKRLTDLLQIVVSLSSEDLQLLWRKPPRTPSEALRYLDHSLPATVPASTMRKLRSAKLGLVMSAKAPAPKVKAAPAPTKAPAALGGVKEKEALLKAIAGALKGKTAEDKSQNSEAVKKSLEAFLETEMGKKIKERALGLLLSKKGIPFTLITGSAALAAMIANNTDIPSTPEIPLSDNLSIKVEFEGTFRKPTGVKFALKFAFGGPTKREGGKKPAVLALPKELHAYIDRIDKRTLIKWFVEQAFRAWEWAGPEEEEEKKKYYQAARDRPDALGLPDTRLAAEALSRKLVETAIQNRIKQLKGKGVQKEVEFDLGHADQWDRFPRKEGLVPRLEWILNLLVPKVPYEALGIEQVTFICGRRRIAVKVKR